MEYDLPQYCAAKPAQIARGALAQESHPMFVGAYVPPAALLRVKRSLRSFETMKYYLIRKAMLDLAFRLLLN